MSYLTPEQYRVLLRPINPRRVGRRDGMSHLEAYDVRAHLNRVLGFARWSGDVVEAVQLYEDFRPLSSGKDGVAVGYRVTYRLTVCAPDGTVLATYTEVATGDGVMPVSKRSDAHDFAVKTAESQAMKRCAINLGDQFGLSLYAKGSMDPLVVTSLVTPFEPDATDKPSPAGPDSHITEQLPAEDQTPAPAPQVSPSQQDKVAELRAAVASTNTDRALSRELRRAGVVTGREMWQQMKDES